MWSEEPVIGGWYWVKVDGRWVPAVGAKNGFITVTNEHSFFLGKDVDFGERIEVPKHLLYKPCPFCGNLELEDSPSKTRIHCRSCGSYGPQYPQFSESPVDRWNKRA